MEKRTKKIVLISASLLAIGGAIGFYIWWKNKNKPSTDVPLATDDSGTPAPPTSSGTTPKADGPSNVKDFQDWLDGKGLKWVGATNADLTNGKKLGQGFGYGNYGQSTQKAWAIYKDQYLSKPTLIPVITPKPIASTGFKKGDNVYLRLNDIGIYEYPSYNSLIGKFVNVDLSKPIGVYEASSAEGFSKVWVNVSGVKLNGWILKKPFWAYLRTAFLKNKD